jgi:hypothetical protein
MGSMGKGPLIRTPPTEIIEAMSDFYPDYIIPPVDRNLLHAELDKDHFIRLTNKDSNHVYIVNHHNAPNVMLEIGRLRELSFARAGGGTGEPVDIDTKDTADNCYQQLIVFSPKDDEIIGGYRFFDCSKVNSPDQRELSTTHYFNFSEQFIKDYLPYTIELGRSWVNPAYQPSVNPRKGTLCTRQPLGWIGRDHSTLPSTQVFLWQGYDV